MMRLGKVISLAMLAVALLCGPTPASGATFDKGDGWYKWSIDGAIEVRSSCCDGSSGNLTFYVRSENGKPARVRASDSNCPAPTTEEVTDLGPVSLARSDSMLLEIIQATDLDKDVREDALFWLVQAGSDATFEYLDRLLSSR